MSSSNPFFCAVIIPTIGRDTLKRAVVSVLNQNFDMAEIEVIVVNDSGRPLPLEQWQQSERVQIIHTTRRERSVARNTGAAIAKSQYLYFLDDDDWLLPGAMTAFWHLSQQAPHAVWLHGGIQVVDESDLPIAEENSGMTGNCLAQIMGGAWVPLQSSLISTQAFFMVGGYNLHIRGTEDQDLCRRLALFGDFANTKTVVACLFRGQTWYTSTDYGRGPEDTRLSRDYIASQPGTFLKMWHSVNSPYWYGRVAHIYFSLALWNIRQRRWLIGSSRLIFGCTAFLGTGRYLLDRRFWQAMKDDHVPGSLYFVEKRLAHRRNST
jgi:glycosyltransferase involved in cell wall biosynthesis